MGYKCCVPNCRSNYKTGPKIPVFRFPKQENLLKIWISAIPRENLVPTKHSRVCKLHFKETDIVQHAEGYNEKTGENIAVLLKNPKLKEGAVPVIFPNCPKYLTKNQPEREHPSSKKERLENEQIRTAILESIKSQEDYIAKHEFQSYDELIFLLDSINISKFWNLVNRGEYFLFFHIADSPFPHMDKSVAINKNCEINVYVKNITLKMLGKFAFPFKCSSINDLNDILYILECNTEESHNNNYVKDILNSMNAVLNSQLENVDIDKKNNLLGIIEQTNLYLKKKNALKYSADYLVLSTLLFTISPHAYRFLRSSGYLILPHPNTLKSLCSNYNLNPQNDNNLTYIKDKLIYLNEQDKKIVFMLDEIYLKPYLDFKGGEMIGVSVNSNNPATTAFVFMIQSITSGYKDVISVLPVQKVDSDYLHKVLLNLIIELEKLGFFVICVSSDNNAINRRAMSFFSNPPKLTFVYIHPSDYNRPLFFVRDIVHLFKCIRNNFINQKNHGKCFYFPSFNAEGDIVIKTASFQTLVTLFEIEKNQLIKHCPTLTQKSIHPSNLEKQNVKLVVQIFNSTLVEGLLLAGEKYNLPHYKDTADFIKIIVTWWEIMNVKSIFKGVHKRNVFQEPLVFSEHIENEKCCFLNSFLNWLDKWKNCKFDSGTLSEETHTALYQTTYGILEIARYCKEELNLNYILTGKFQTDALENRFGKYRQLAGGQYHISLTQLMEIEKKLRIQSLLPLTLKSSLYGDISIESPNENNDEMPLDLSLPKNHIVYLMQKFNFSLEDEDILSILEVEDVIVYIAGYCIHSCLNRLKCDFCKENLTIQRESGQSCKLICNLDRGGLIYPNAVVVDMISTSYTVTSKLLSKDYEAEFIKMSNHRAVAFALIEHHLNSQEKGLDIEDCVNGHTPPLVQKYLIQACINIFFKNYCKNINNNLQDRSNKKRKLKTLTESNIVKKEKVKIDLKPKSKNSKVNCKKKIPTKINGGENEKAKSKAGNTENIKIAGRSGSSKKTDRPINLSVKKRKLKP